MNWTEEQYQAFIDKRTHEYTHKTQKSSECAVMEVKGAKYRNKKTEVDGIKFDSIAEAKRYSELKFLEKAGKITDLKLQPKFELQEKYTINGRNIRAITYIADFQYIEDGKTIVEDVKGQATEVFKIKQKMFEKKYQQEIKIVR